MIDALLAEAAQWPELGVSTGLAGFVILLWRQDRKERELERIRQDAAYRELASDFRKIVQDNTAALIHLSDALAQRTVQCPAITREEDRRIIGARGGD